MILRDKFIFSTKCREKSLKTMLYFKCGEVE